MCVRACREVHVIVVIGMAYRGENSKIVFDFDDPMGDSTCVACGECVQACPTGALMPASVVDKDGVGHSDVDKKVNSVCPYCGVGCQIEYNVKDNITTESGSTTEENSSEEEGSGLDTKEVQDDTKGLEEESPSLNPEEMEALTSNEEVTEESTLKENNNDKQAKEVKN